MLADAVVIASVFSDVIEAVAVVVAVAARTKANDSNTI